MRLYNLYPACLHSLALFTIAFNLLPLMPLLRLLSASVLLAVASDERWNKEEVISKKGEMVVSLLLR